MSVGIVSLTLAMATAPEAAWLFNGQGNQLDRYDLAVEPPGYEAAFIPNAAAGGKDLNAQICAFPGGEHILLGEDSNQTGGVPQGWGVFDVATRTEIGKLVADYGPTPQPENYGCAIETDGEGAVRRIFVSQVGTGGFASSDGQLIVFFPSSRSLDSVLRGADPDTVCPGGDCSALDEDDSDWCILDDDVGTAGGLALDGDGNVYLAAQAPAIPPEIPAPGRILRYAAAGIPAGPADCPSGTKILEPETFIQDLFAGTPSAIVAAHDANGDPTGTWYVSSVFFLPVVNEYGADGSFLRNVVAPGHGSPFGLAVGSDGTLYFADLGLGIDPAAVPEDASRFGVGPVDGEGSVQRVRFVELPDGSRVPLAPEVLAEGLDFPDGLGILE